MPRFCKPISRRVLDLALAGSLIALAGCETYQAVEPGLRPVGDGMTVTSTKPWVSVNTPYALKGPDVTWTLDGLGLNRLLIFGGIDDGKALITAKQRAGVPPPPAFARTMDGLELGELVGATVSRTMAGGVAVETLSLNPVTFMAHPGFEMEFAFPTSSGLEMRGFASGANIDGELFLVMFVAPRMHYYGKDLAEARAIAASARQG